MKKIILNLFIFLCFTNLFATPIEKITSKYIDDNYTNKEFLSKNPLYYLPENYFPELNCVAGKIVKITTEDYEIRKNGIKAYGDSESREFITKYLVFDKKGHITDEYAICPNEDGYIFFKTHKVYEYYNDKIVVKNFDLKKNKFKEEKYEISRDENSLYLIKRDGENDERIIFSKGNVKYEEYENNLMKYEKSYFFNNQAVKSIYYLVNKDLNPIKTREYQYSRGALNLQVDFLRSGPEVYRFIYETNPVEGTKRTIETRDSQVVEDYNYYLIRTFDEKCGFLNYQFTRPLENGALGKYAIITKELLLEPDDIFSKYFSSEN